jgi:hypothetical protein
MCNFTNQNIAFLKSAPSTYPKTFVFCWSLWLTNGSHFLGHFCSLFPWPSMIGLRHQRFFWWLQFPPASNHKSPKIVYKCTCKAPGDRLEARICISEPCPQEPTGTPCRPSNVWGSGLQYAILLFLQDQDSCWYNFPIDGTLVLFTESIYTQAIFSHRLKMFLNMTEFHLCLGIFMLLGNQYE